MWPDTFALRLADTLEGFDRDTWASPLDLAVALDPDTVRTPALELINAELVKVEAGETDRLIVCMPPQEGKSTLVTKLTPLWFLIRNPQRRIGIASYAQSLADEFGRDVRGYITNNAGADDTLDLGLRIAPDNGSVRRWALNGHRGGVKAVGLAGGLTGHPLDALFIDDPISNPEQAQSHVYRQRGVNFWQATGSTRLAPGSPVVVVLTRWHENDLAGHLLSAPDGNRWKLISIPAIAESPEDPLGRDVGEPMISARGERDWDAIRVERGEYVWAALYQQRPAPAEGGLFKRNEVKHWTWCDAPTLGRPAISCDGREVYLDSLWKFVTADLATSLKTSADYTAAGVWGVTLDGDLILLDGIRKKLEPDQHWPEVNQLRTRWDVAAVYVEAAMNATTLAYEAGRSGIPIRELTPDKDKWTRAQPAAARINAGRLWVPSVASAPWVADWLDEWAAFNNGAHDDTVDVLAYAAHVAATHFVPTEPAALTIARLTPANDGLVDLMDAHF